MNFRQVRQNLAEKADKVVVNRNLTSLIGVDPNKVKNALIRLKRNPNPNLLPDNVKDHYYRYIDASISAAEKAARLNKNLFREEILDEDFMPPQMLVLKRTGIRIFPDGRRVALYNNDKLGFVVTLPYKSTGLEEPVVNVQEESQEELLETMDQIAKYAQSKPSSRVVTRHIKFGDGSKMKVSHGAAKAIHMVHSSLNNGNKKKFEELLTEPKSFVKAANFALNNVQFSVNKP